ncbi:hypothetical protein D3C71_1037240 [compost metagenome]
MFFRKLFSSMATVTINGRTFYGDNVTIRGDKVYVDGQLSDVGLNPGQKELDIKVTEGILGTLDAGGSVVCGEVHHNVDAGGSITVNGNVGGDADAGGSVSVNGDVRGSVDAGGSATISGSVAGSIDAGGSVRVGKA